MGYSAKCTLIIDPMWLIWYTTPAAPKVSREARHQLAGFFFQLGIDGRAFLQGLQQSITRDHRDGVAAERACLVHFACRRNVLHDLAPACKRAYGHAAADDLAEGHNIRLNAQQLLRAAFSKPEARHHFVHDEQDAMRIAKRAQASRKPGCGRMQPMLPAMGSTMMAAICSGYSAISCSTAGKVVVRHAEGVFSHAGRYAGHGLDAERGNAAARAHEERIRMAMVIAFRI